MHRLNLLRPQEKTVCLFVFFFSPERSRSFFFLLRISSQSYTEKRMTLRHFLIRVSLLLFVVMAVRLEGGREAAASESIRLQTWSHLLGFFFLRSDSNDATRRGHAMAIRKSVKQHWLCEANSQFALFSVSLYETPKLLLIYFPTIGVSSVVPMCCCYSHRPLGVSVVTQEGGGGSLAIIWSRLRWNSSLSKVL